MCTGHFTTFGQPALDQFSCHSSLLHVRETATSFSTKHLSAFADRKHFLYFSIEIESPNHRKYYDHYLSDRVLVTHVCVSKLLAQIVSPIRRQATVCLL